MFEQSITNYYRKLMMASQTIETIRMAIAKFDTAKVPIAALLVVNLKRSGTADDYAEFSVLTEYFSDKELEDLLTGFREIASYVDVSFGEKEFITKLANGYFNKLDGHHKIVYASTGSGLSRCRSAVTPGLCELYKLDYCSSDACTAAVLENKISAIRTLRYGGFPMPNTYFYDHVAGWLEDSRPRLDQILIAKPAYECASIGVNENAVSKWSAAFEAHVKRLSQMLRQPMILQEFIHGYEVETPVFEAESPIAPSCVGVSIAGDKDLGSRFFTYEQIYSDDFSLYNFDLHHPELAVKMKDCATSVFSFLQLRGTVRIDFRVKENGEFFIMDCNNSPHIVPGHSVHYSMQLLGFTFPETLKLILSSSI